ncbi:Transposon Tf2 [Seminavis robusta]|uniref:Transposon Tf2 n=1 Tax=Seminavis robusta TaxID=568900 RepID=A0A9N8HRV8_9STRA|nr:Transposon Tf2 [Seminavis robusta]|eukprot:Sro1364_g266420.1 Transposon Tf2 (335) ;mRNA; f:2803-4104
MTEEEAFALVEEAFEMTPRTWRQFYQPLTIAEIGRAQKNDKYVQTLRQQAPDRLGEFFEDIGRKSGPDRVITETDVVDGDHRIIVPAALTQRLMEWYHTTLVHPGVNRLYNTLRQHYTWPKMLEQIRTYIRSCHACQLGKRGMRGYGKIPLKDTETEPWKDVAVDLSGPWKATVDNKEIATKHLKEDPIKDLTSAAAYAMRATVHGVTKYSPSQLVYQRDMILRTKMEADVERVRQRREAAIQVNNTRENRRRIAHNYKKGDHVLIKSSSMDPKMQLNVGPFKVVSFNKASGTLHIQRRNYIEPINIRLVRPYFGSTTRWAIAEPLHAGGDCRG